MVFSQYYPHIQLNEKILFFFLLIISFTSRLYSFNHSEIVWKTVSTKNFLIHYNDKTKPAVFAAWKIAEEAFGAFNNLYNFEGTPKINMVLADYDDYSNGYAAWTNRTIMIWIPDVQYDFRSNTTWLRNVITHELAHIMSLDKKSRMQLINWTFQTQYLSPEVTFEYQEPFAFSSFFPNWFTEGTAQLRTEELGNDCWDSRRSMVFRCAILEDKLLTQDEMGHFNHTALGNELVYNQGYLFVKFLENKIGKKEIASLWNSTRSNKLFGTNFDRYFIRNYNMSIDSLYTIWKDSMLTIAESLLPAHPTSVSSVWEHGTINSQPHISNDLHYMGWLTNHKDDFLRTDLVIFKKGNKKPIARLKYAKAGWAFSPDGKTVYYIKSRNPDSNGSFFNDLFSYQLSTGTEVRLTRSARIYDVAVSSDGKKLICVQYFKNAYRLVIFSLDKSEFSEVAHSVLGEPFLTASVIDIDSSRLILSKIIKGKSGIFELDLNTGTMNPLINSEFQEENPYYAQNGRIYFNADYDGIFNIYSILPDGTDLKRHTNVNGGAFTPVSGQSDTIIFSEYTSNGFRISTCESKGAAYQIQTKNTCHFKPLPIPSGTVRINSEFYKKKYLKPVWELYTSFIVTDNDNAFQKKLRTGDVSTPPWEISFDFITELSMVTSDAVEQKKMHAGGAVMLNTLWKLTEKDIETNIHYQGVFGRLQDISLKSKGILQTNRELKEYQKQSGFSAPFIKNALDYAARNETRASDGSTIEDSIDIISRPFLIPFWGIENTSLKPTIGMNAQALLLLFIPGIINIEPFIELQLARDFYIGLKSKLFLDPQLLFDNFGSGFYLTTPLWIRRDLKRYINEDILYNLGGITSYGAFIGVDIEPIEYIQNNGISPDSMVSDTTIESVTSFSYGIDISHSFPLLKYMSLTLSTENYGTKYTSNVLQVGNDGDRVYYNLLISSLSQAAITFPIMRNINRGKLYADNLYGTIFYQLKFLGSNEFLSHPELSLFTDKKYSSKYAFLSHKIGFGIELGFIKNFVFERTLELTAAWDIFDEEINVDMSVKF